ncbi:MAG TPA: dipeptidase [Myxococcota bacterium]|nr:dipeptidase [Myxococcota bacterium]
MNEKVLDYVKNNQDRFLAELFDWLRIPSVSALPEHNGDVRRAGEWVVSKLQAIGFENVGLKETTGHPAVYGDWLHAPGKPTILVYGHYDVQPVDPIEKWHSNPFEPVVKDGFIYGRGTSDDKGQVATHLFALESILKVTGRLPCNVKVFIEGEEEGGTGGTADFVTANRDLLACDAVAISDTGWYSPDLPTIVYALRGLAYFHVDVFGPDRDLHSGSYGGMLQNPLNAVAKIIAALQDADGRITIPGYYDDVVELTELERAEFRKVESPEDQVAREIGVPVLWGEKGFSAIERNWARPSFDVNGIWGGFSGEGAKTVIAAEGGFKVSSRLVAGQDPEKVAVQFKDHIERVCPPGVRVKVTYLHGATPVMVPVDSPFITAGQNAIEKTFGKRPVLVREGASIPITATFLTELKAPSIMVGYGLLEDNIHSPDEKFKLSHFQKGIECGVVLYEEFASVSR